ncbi:hypothetical protein B0H19DRAFT_1088136 [Mycena capillaripes]|nr:hypothetical protein B0H19DRAFT_1088136 [Mycena capillaripes]
MGVWLRLTVMCMPPVVLSLPFMHLKPVQSAKQKDDGHAHEAPLMLFKVKFTRVSIFTQCYRVLSVDTRGGCWTSRRRCSMLKVALQSRWGVLRFGSSGNGVLGVLVASLGEK